MRSLFEKLVAHARLPRWRRPVFDYAVLYDEHASAASNDEEVVGIGHFDLIGRIELSILVEAGLRPSDVLVDLGCGVGRLAVHAVKFLNRGRYIGIDVADSILSRAEELVGATADGSGCRVKWIRSSSQTFPLPDRSADMICAFSVFTHVEHEDAYRYLSDGMRVVRPNGRFVFSCLPLDLKYAQEVFLQEARVSLRERWSRVRNIATSREFMDEMSQLAGWRVAEWFRGDDAAFTVFGSTERTALGQSVCVLDRQHAP